MNLKAYQKKFKITDTVECIDSLTVLEQAIILFFIVRQGGHTHKEIREYMQQKKRIKGRAMHWLLRAKLTTLTKKGLLFEEDKYYSVHPVFLKLFNKQNPELSLDDANKMLEGTEVKLG